jgi:tRNA modification GTPase
MHTGDTIAAIASPPGRSTRGIVRLSGPATREVLATVLAGPPRPFDRLCFRGRLRLGQALLPVLVATYRAPDSYTAEDSAEILLPGNPTLLQRIMDALLSITSVRLATPGEFTARAYLNNRLTLDQAEAVAATIAAESDSQLAAARSLLQGRTGRSYREWADEIATLLALVEAGIDFTDQEDVVAISAEDLRLRITRLLERMNALSGTGNASAVRTDLPRVVLAGEPNAGKSTLFNALLGTTRAVVSDVAGTTRDVLEERLDLSRDLPGAGTVAIIDIAGLDEDAVGLDRQAQAAAADAIAAADVVLHCDPTGAFPSLNARAGTPVLRIRTKADLMVVSEGEPGSIRVCALDRWNLPALRRAIAEAATGGRGGDSQVIPRHQRALAQAQAALRESLATGQPETIAASLRAALDAMGELVGRISPDDVIGRIFATFCVGK